MTSISDRQRKKNEDLANQIFGRSKSKPNAEKKQKERTPSLASRMGVQKVRMPDHSYADPTLSTSTPLAVVEGTFADGIVAANFIDQHTNTEELIQPSFAALVHNPFASQQPVLGSCEQDSV